MLWPVIQIMEIVIGQVYPIQTMWTDMAELKPRNSQIHLVSRKNKALNSLDWMFKTVDLRIPTRCSSTTWISCSLIHMPILGFHPASQSWVVASPAQNTWLETMVLGNTPTAPRATSTPRFAKTPRAPLPASTPKSYASPWASTTLP